MNIKQLEQRNLEVLAEELHKFYRAAFKALHSASCFIKCSGAHDHGWSHCNKKKYFLNRARILQKNLMPPMWKMTGEKIEEISKELRDRTFKTALVPFDEPGQRVQIHGAGCDDVYETHEEPKP